MWGKTSPLVSGNRWRWMGLMRLGDDNCNAKQLIQILLPSPAVYWDKRCADWLTSCSWLNLSFLSFIIFICLFFSPGVCVAGVGGGLFSFLPSPTRFPLEIARPLYLPRWRFRFKSSLNCSMIFLSRCLFLDCWNRALKQNLAFLFQMLFVSFS